MHRLSSFIPRTAGFQDSTIQGFKVSIAEPERLHRSDSQFLEILVLGNGTLSLTLMRTGLGRDAEAFQLIGNTGTTAIREASETLNH